MKERFEGYLKIILTALLSALLAGGSVLVATGQYKEKIETHDKKLEKLEQIADELHTWVEVQKEINKNNEKLVNMLLNYHTDKSQKENKR